MFGKSELLCWVFGDIQWKLTITQAFQNVVLVMECV